jgi:hypothetical protein
MKECKICKVTKSFDEYYKHPKSKDGHSQKCKDCSKKLSDDRYKKLILDPEFHEKEKARRRVKEKKVIIPISKHQIYLNYKEKFPEKYKVGVMLKHHPKKSTHHLHHWSYNEIHFDDCIELTPQDHKTAHKFIIYDQERYMYRRIDTMELLDTKEEHEQYIKQKLKNKDKPF